LFQLLSELQQRLRQFVLAQTIEAPANSPLKVLELGGELWNSLFLPDLFSI
jgi:hypothetical protein